MVLAFNAGFFEKDNVGRLSAGGLLAIEGVVRHQPWKEKRGGVLAISADGQMSVITQKDYPFLVKSTLRDLVPSRFWRSSRVETGQCRQMITICSTEQLFA